ncbi:MAG TPA: molybdopterin-binding protein [Candidatus Pelagibacter bacterium]|jgi:molybdenum cofactor synthesis domain-containing protein|nr:molybdopterin-binding protein [Candidatus Pelagibacter bacterium]|tara:strand:+ start:2472 stop:3224 length:753 start_codon:yes stop_codon:yes gene_type:complete
MTNKKEIIAGIIIIGNEVLSGRTKDINTSNLAEWLNSLGIEVKEVRIIPDDEQVIIDTVNELRNNFNYVFTTGGIGPTHDDITAKSISKAFSLEYGYHKEAFSILENYYKPGEFNEGRQKMAKMPITAKLIINPSSGAPGFYVENVFCLPGVPSILNSMLGGLNNVLVGGDQVLSKTLNLRTVESEIAKPLSDVQKKNNEVEIGSYPFFRAGKLGVSIVLRSTNQKKIDQCNDQILEFVKEKKIEILRKI